jgi:hypothetical protein
MSDLRVAATNTGLVSLSPSSSGGKISSSSVSVSAINMENIKSHLQGKKWHLKSTANIDQSFLFSIKL